MKFLVPVLLSFAFASCTPNTPLSKQFYDANKVKVLIGTTDPPRVHFETNDVDKIKGWLGFIDEKGTASGNCKYEGTLVLYFTETDTNVMRFSTAAGCQQITYTVDGQTVTRPLTKAGVAYLDSLSRIY